MVETGTPAAAPATPAAPVDAAQPKVEQADPKTGISADVMPKDGAKSQDTPIQKMKFKLNINGKLEDKEYTEEELQQHLQRTLGIQEKYQAAVPKIEAAEQLIEMLNSDPKAFRKIAKENGLDADKLAADILWEKMRWDKLTPEQQELEVLKNQKAEEERVAKEAEDEKKAQETDTKTKEWATKFEQDATKALQSQGVPKTRFTLALMAQYVDAGLANKQEYTPEQVLPFVMRDIQQIQKETIGSLDGDALLAYLGDDLTEKISKARVAKFKKGVDAPAPKKKEEPKPMPDRLKGKTGRAYFRELSKMKSEQGIGAYPEQ